jgi:predicted PurR-regulated permease PerM
MGGILALLSHPLYQRLQKRKVPPKVASLLITIAIFILVIGPISLFVIQAVRQGVSIGQALAKNDDISFQALMDRIAHWRLVEAVVGDSAAFELQARSAVQSLGKGATTVILGLVADTPKILFQLALAAISLFFLLIDGRTFLDWITDKTPLDSDVRAKLVDSFQSTTVSVIWATLAAAAAQSSVILFSFLILRIPAAFLATGATFVFAWIPVIGSAPVWISGALYLYLKGAIVRCFAMIGLGLITGVVDNFVRPLVLRGRGGMHPLVSLIAIFGGIRMFGFAGVFLGPIVVAVMTALLQTWPTVAKRFGLIRE